MYEMREVVVITIRVSISYFSVAQFWFHVIFSIDIVNNGVNVFGNNLLPHKISDELKKVEHEFRHS